MKNYFLLIPFLFLTGCCRSISKVNRCQEKITTLDEYKYKILGDDCNFIKYLVHARWVRCFERRRLYAYDKELIQSLNYANDCFIGLDNAEILKIFGQPTSQVAGTGSNFINKYIIRMNNCHCNCYELKIIFDSQRKVTKFILYHLD